MSLTDLVTDNTYPIVFIGSGMSKRYLSNSPTWNLLLKDYWEKIGEEKNFYTFMRDLKKDVDPNALKSEQDFIANVRVASHIEKTFNNLFYEEKLVVPGLSIEEAYNNEISPFKFDLSNLFKDYSYREEIDNEELELYKAFLSKAKVIVTTNYDTLIEDLLQELEITPKKYIGQNGFFDKTLDWSELYKIHGDVNEPNSIIINESDYEGYDNNSILISAKLLSELIESPIIFLGYSLTDRNVRTLLNDFSSQLPKEDLRKSASRITVVEYDSEEPNVIDQIVKDDNLDFSYTLIKTNNYKEIFSSLSSINEGLTPFEVLRYQKAIKQIVVEAGSKGNLDAVLVSPNDLDELEDDIKNGKNIVVALGNKRNLFVYPDIVSYLKDYLFDENEILPRIALTFISKDGSRLTKTPMSKYLIQENVDLLNLEEDVIDKINNKIENLSTLDDLIDTLSPSHQRKFKTIRAIQNKKFKKTREINYIIFNIKNLNRNDLDDYIKNIAFPEFVSATKNKTNLRTDLRKLFLAYDLLKNGDLKKIKKTP